MWLNDRQAIGVAFESHYRNIFASVHPNCSTLLQDLIQPALSSSINAELTQCPSPLEIRKAVFSMGNYKSPGPDNYMKHT